MLSICVVLWLNNGKEWMYKVSRSLRIDRYHITLLLFLLFSLSYTIILKSNSSNVDSYREPAFTGSDINSFSEADFFPDYFRKDSAPSYDIVEAANETSSSAQNFVQTVVLSSGGSFYQAILDLGVDVRSAYSISKVVSDVYNTSRIKAGGTIVLQAQSSDGRGVPITGRPEKILAKFSDAKVEVWLDKRIDKYQAKLVPIDILVNNVFVEGEVKESLYADAQFKGVSPATIMNFIKLFSYGVDFQRDIGARSKFKVLYTSHTNDAGEKVQGDEILYASLTTKGQEIEVYRYTYKDGTHGYFHKDGSSIRKSLLRTPINSAKISSGFGMRKHPILGYSRMHKGLDYAAPRGTPVLAAGDGVIEIASGHKSYGKYIKIKHDKKYDTLYAHLDKFNNIKPGKRVRQGEVIGFVGNSGMSTGAHLHYEVHVHGKQVNPANASMARKMEGIDKKNIKSFKAHQANIERMIANKLYASNAIPVVKNSESIQ